LTSKIADVTEPSAQRLELPNPGPSVHQGWARQSRQEPQAGAWDSDRAILHRAGDNGYAGVTWEQRTASIVGEGGKVVFEQRDVEVPSSWSQTATNVVVQKYFRGQLGTPGRERSVRQLIDRVADTITRWGIQDGYFADQASADNYRAEAQAPAGRAEDVLQLSRLVQRGHRARSTVLSLFINSVDDTMESILGLAKTEGMLFKYGSGTGTNLSPIRSSKNCSTAAEPRRARSVS